MISVTDLMTNLDNGAQDHRDGPNGPIVQRLRDALPALFTALGARSPREVMGDLLGLLDAASRDDTTAANALRSTLTTYLGENAVSQDDNSQPQQAPQQPQVQQAQAPQQTPPAPAPQAQQAPPPAPPQTPPANPAPVEPSAAPETAGTLPQAVAGNPPGNAQPGPTNG